MDVGCVVRVVAASCLAEPLERGTRTSSSAGCGQALRQSGDKAHTDSAAVTRVLYSRGTQGTDADRGKIERAEGAWWWMWMWMRW